MHPPAEDAPDFQAAPAARFLRAVRNQMPETLHGYPYDIPAIRHLKELRFEAPVTFFVGENGSGKSTLLEALALKMRLNAEGGSRNFNFATAATHSPLHTHLETVRTHLRARDAYFLRAESFYNVATEIDRKGVNDYYGCISLHERSHGESFLDLVCKRFGGDGFYLLDEPEAALSPARQLALLARMRALVAKHSQFIIATHSPILLAYPDAEIFEFGETGLRKIAYEDTQAYQITRYFLNHREGVLAELFAETP